MEIVQAVSRCAVTLFGDFLRNFVVEKNNGGRVSFQTKRAQQVSWLSIVVVYIVLCSEIDTAAPERLRADQHSSRSIGGALQACFGLHHEFFTIVQGKLVFLLSLKAQLRPRDKWLCKGQVTDTPTLINREALNRWRKKVRERPASRWLAPWPRVSSPPFSTAKSRHKTLKSVTVHL